MSLFDKIKNAVNTVADAVSSYQERQILDSEYFQADKVFHGTLPPKINIIISDGLGAGQRPYTVPRPLTPWKYVIYIGPQAFPRADVPPFDHTLIHELTHVWQGFHGRSRWGYVCNSVINQAIYGTGAYDYQPGDAWGHYNAEQQAELVEDWYRMGMRKSDDDPRWHYIRDNIRDLEP